MNRWVHRIGASAKTPLEVSAELAPPGWGGVLGIDGKAVWVAGEERCLLVGVDQKSQDVVHALMAQGRMARASSVWCERRSSKAAIP